MRKTTIGIAILLVSFVTGVSFAAPNAASKNEPIIPYYNGGYSFGLARYSAKPAANVPDQNVCSDSDNESDVDLQVMQS